MFCVLPLYSPAVAADMIQPLNAFSFLLYQEFATFKIKTVFQPPRPAGDVGGHDDLSVTFVTAHCKIRVCERLSAV